MAAAVAASLFPIAPHDAVAPGQELAGDAGRNDAAVPIDDLHLYMRLDAPDRRHTALQGIVMRALEADRARLGHAVGDGELSHVHALDDAPHHLVRRIALPMK